LPAILHQRIFAAEILNNIIMEKIIHRANTRGRSQYDWLDSKHNFSFAGYTDRNRVHFGALRVLNDDIVQPGTGFSKHPHDNMEIISIPIKGALKHEDSMHHQQIINENEVQVMSAGTGIFHSEYNASETEPVNFLQLWIYPNKRNVKPVYDQKLFDPAKAKNKWQKLVTSLEDDMGETLKIHQNATISRVMLDENSEINYSLDRTNYGSFLFVIKGEIEIDNDTFSERDAVGLTETKDFKIKAKKDSYILNIDVPDLK
jgi:quercetin 2,3-dioxygenase